MDLGGGSRWQSLTLNGKICIKCELKSYISRVDIEKYISENLITLSETVMSTSLVRFLLTLWWFVLLVFGCCLFDFFILNLSFRMLFIFMKKKKINLCYFRFLHFLSLLGSKYEKFMCYVEFTKYMPIRLFKLMWHFFNESNILVA